MSEEKNVYVRDSIDVVPKDKRDFTFWNLLVIFMGMQVPVSYFIVGGAITAGLTLAQAIGVTIGAFIIGFLLFALVGLIGQQAGVTTMVASRSAFGIVGSVLPALIIFVTLSGWDSVHIQLAGVLLNVVSHGLFGFGSQQVYSIIVGAIIVTLVLFGAKILNRMEQFLVPAVILLVLMALYVALGGHNFSDLLHQTVKGHLTLTIAFDAMVVQPLTWIPMVADYTRFSPTKKASFFAALLGAIPVAVLMNVIGQISAVSLGNANPIVPMVQHGKVFGVIAFIVVIFATIATAALILYSATISGLSIFYTVPIKRLSSIIGVICIALAVFVNLLSNVINWLSFLGLLLVPLFPIILVDYFFVHKGHYDGEALFDRTGRYMYYKGFNILGYIAWICGSIVFFIGKSTSIGGAVLGMVAAAIVYYLLNKLGLQQSRAIPVADRGETAM